MVVSDLEEISMADQDHVFIVIEWQERGTMAINGNRIQEKGRRVCTVDNYPRKLPCHNPECEGGGFEISTRISALLRSDEYSEQNSLICINAIRKGSSKRCLHTIFYSITRVLPYQREISSAAASSHKAS
jgi:hypothetical protein